jgi:exonuclease SbcC
MKEIKPVENLVDDVEDKFEETKKKLDKAKAAMDYHQMECAKLELKESDIDLFWASINSKSFFSYRGYTENDLREKIAGLITAIDTKTEKLRKKNDYTNYLKEEIERLEEKKPHPYQKSLPLLDGLYKTISMMQQKLSIESQDYIKELQSPRVDRKNISKEKQNYFHLVFVYLAMKIGFILHINKTYKLKKIDLIDGTIFTAEGNEIKIKDMGTGQSQSAYLTGLLSSGDNRKIIALFDEVAMMDNRSLRQVHAKLKELYEEERLLVGVIVQKAEELRVVPIA